MSLTLTYWFALAPALPTPRTRWLDIFWILDMYIPYFVLSNWPSYLLKVVLETSTVGTFVVATPNWGILATWATALVLLKHVLNELLIRKRTTALMLRSLPTLLQ